MSKIAFVLLALALASGAVAGTATFVDTWRSAGFTSSEANQGVAFGDYDGDGHTDLFLGSIFFPNPIPMLPDLGGPDQLYRNDGTGNFSDQAAAVGVGDDGQAQGAAWADYDNDGALDLYVVRGLQTALAQTHRLYRQTPPTFDSAPSAHVSAAVAGRSVCWADYDDDGHVDVFVTNGLDSFDLLPNARIYLFRKQADGSFADVTIAAGLEDTRNGHGCAWSDYDNDGDMDLYVANKGFEDPVLGLTDPQKNALYQNQLADTGTATFVDVAEAAGVDGIDAFDPGGASFGAAWADFDGDGWMDLYVTNGFSGVVPLPTPNRLYRNRGDGTFADETILRFGLGVSTESSFSQTWADFDNDGDLDLYVCNGDQPIAAATNDYYENSGPPFHQLRDEAAAAGLEEGMFAQACASADIDGDGWLDIYATNDLLILEFADRLYRNDGGSEHWLQLDLVGTASNRAAIGARVTLTAGGRSQTREVAAGHGYQSMDDLRIEFGLGSALEADEVTIAWPSGCVQQLGPTAADQRLEVVEACRSILRDELRDPVGSMFPLPPYEVAPAAGPWVDPQGVLADPRTFFYQHDDNVVIQLVKSAGSIAISW